MYLFLALMLTALFVWLLMRAERDRRPAIRTVANSPVNAGPDVVDPAVALARQRYASGEIEREEFVRVMRALSR